MQTIKITPTGTKDIEIKLGRFRLTNGLRIGMEGCEYIPATEKLALEAKGRADNYYVIAFIEYKEGEETCDMRTIGPRFHEAVETYENWKNVQTLIKIAFDLIVTMNCNKEDE